MTSKTSWLNQYAPSVLLIAVLACGGAKSPLWFSAWALLALAYAMVAVQPCILNRRHIGYFLVFTGGVVISHIYSLDPASSLFWTVQCLTFSCLWLAFKTAPQQTNPDKFWNTLLILGILTCIVTTYQWITQHSPYGLLPINPNFNAIWMAALAVAYLSKTRPHQIEKFLTLWLVALVVCGRSRSGLLGLLVGSSYGATRRYPSSWVLAGLGLSGIIAFLVPHSWFFDRLNLFEHGARLRIWGVAWEGFLERPLTGYGLGNFELAYLKYAFPVEGAVRYGHTTAFVHNDYLQALCELGWPTAGVLLYGIGSVLKCRPSHHVLAAPAKAMILSLMTAALFNPVFKMPIFVYLAILAASWLQESVPVIDNSPVLRDKISRVGLFLIMSMVGMLLMWFGLRSWWASQQRWESVLRWNHKDAEAWHELARHSDDSGQALYDEQKAVEESPFEPYYREALARSLESLPGKDHLPEALEAYIAAIRLAPTRAVNELAVARLLFRSGEAGSALAWAEKACALEPNYWEASFWKARALQALGRHQEAIFVIKDLIRRHDQFRATLRKPPQSPYEESILAYEDQVVRLELARYISHPSIGVQ